MRICHFSEGLSRLLRSAAQRALRSERRSQKWERERERRSQKRQSAKSAAHFSYLRSQSFRLTELENYSN